MQDSHFAWETVDKNENNTALLFSEITFVFVEYVYNKNNIG